MKDDESSYVHRPVRGLPASLLEREGDTLSVIALMQRQAGLNRELRRELQQRVKAGGSPQARDRDLIPAAELRLATLYLMPGPRFTSFWFIVRQRLAAQGKSGRLQYALAVDVQLLNAYEPRWPTLEIDLPVLLEACPEWSRIQAHFGDLLAEIGQQLPLGVFMLWPRLVEELGGWDRLDETRRRTIANAVFALSSVAYSDWFIATALRMCPGLAQELGALVDGQAGAPDGNGHDSGHALAPPPSGGDDDSCTPEPIPRNAVVRQRWEALLERLEEKVAELREQPTRESVEELTMLVRDFEQIAHELPPRELAGSARFDESLASLVEHLRTLAQREDYEWLDAELLDQITARWRLAARDRLGQVELMELSQDADSGRARVDKASSELGGTRAQVSGQSEVVAAFERELENVKGFAQQAVVKRKRAEAQKYLLELESAQQSLQERLVDAASPFAHPYDYSCDYVELFKAAPGEDSDDFGAVNDPSNPEPARPLPDNPDEQTAGPVSQDVSTGRTLPVLPDQDHPGASETRSGPPVSSAGEVASGDGSQTGSPAERVVEVEPDRSQPAPDPFHDGAGDICRPIWKALLDGHPAHAFHAATWIASIHPDIKVPPPDLLAAVCLERDLLLPDGGIQSALASRFERLRPEDFDEKSPRDWHAAINLLLASATIRPMILAPGTGAASVAAYHHQDGRYPALYALVHALRELSQPLMSFRIEPAVLGQARSEAAIRADLQALQREADDWLRVQAPAFTIKFAAATNVWRHWLRAGEAIDSLVTPVVHNRVADAIRVREQLSAMSDHDHVLRLIREADRKALKRRRGEDIHSGALDQLLRSVQDALQFPRRWLALTELLGQRGGRMREAVERVHAELKKCRTDVEDELQRPPSDDRWGLVRAAQSQALRALQGVFELFESVIDPAPIEASPPEVLGAPLLTVPGVSLSDDWIPESRPTEALACMREWQSAPTDEQAVLQTRLDRGDVQGAEMMVQARLAKATPSLLRQERERWKHLLRKELGECRRTVEVGSAYGYLKDADRRKDESLLATHEAQIDEIRRFDRVLAELSEIRTRVDEARDNDVRKIRDAITEMSIQPDMHDVVEEIERSLMDGDIASANELLPWLAKGHRQYLVPEHESKEGFDAFFPKDMQAIETWLAAHRRSDVESALKQGKSIPGIEARQVADAQRSQAAKLFGYWSDIKSNRAAEQKLLEPLLTGLGLTIRDLRRSERLPDREIWLLGVDPIEERHVCPTPMFGSLAGGKYRLVCAWGRPTDEDLLQWVGDSAVSRPTLLFYFDRMTERKWRELSRLSKVRRRAFLILDDVMLVFLSLVGGSRLRAWFEAALPFTFTSPYDATAGVVPPEMFYGRGAELEAVRGLNGRCFIYGGRQLGKTALLKRAEQSFHAPSRGHFAKWVDLRAEGIGVSRAPHELWTTLHEKLQELGVLDPKVIAPVPGKKQGIEALTRAILHFLNANSDRRMLLLLDEADRFFEQDGRNDFEETRRLKQLMDETARRFKVVFAGLHNVLRMTERPNHPLAHFGEPIEIGPLREGEEVREAAELVRRPMAAAGFAFENRRLQIRILAQTNYYPSLIQLYCSHLLRHLLAQVAEKQRLDGPRYLVTDRDIEQVYSSDALRDEIRAKFRLTLQLDPRYEIVAYSMAHDLLLSRYSHSDGVPWQTIRQSGAIHWWAEGFRDTSELDFRVLLDEMVGLGVLARLPGGRYNLRNPNVLLLLGTQDEIEAVLLKDREPAVEFESTTFRPPLRRTPGAPARNVFTYQQLSRLLQRANGISVVTGSRAAGIDNVVTSLQDYLGREADPVVLAECDGKRAFGDALGAALSARERDQVTLIVIPHELPWSEQWLLEARQRLDRLKSGNNFASLVFIAEPSTLWNMVHNGAPSTGMGLPWISLLPWSDAFVRSWLDDRRIPLEAEDRRKLRDVTGYWPDLLIEIGGDVSEVRTLRERISAGERWWVAPQSSAPDIRARFGLDVAEPASILEVLAQLGEAVDPDTLSAVAERPRELIQASLRWGELLGLVHQEGAQYWIVDHLAAVALRSSGA